ncbi:formate/nitrite transporter family protein [Streptococcus loxodontisalivarius]|uniref:Formate/nitrite transporter FocA (FNT family) n=1 Tax=Streptococcus loxodontisalivarius TaxID=1349415 RepID=A0ABS2PS39_9STRE|nr:formate/nitrite transporter family protein [Streptococcus loxodontisalivarius]MBM7642858.1 formate/nitrite transporter FocA (FNT family) [Streptococcus loxodontisalivarius]
MNPFQEKIAAACAKKEALFDESLGRYALRSMFAGAFLTMSTAVGVIGADVISTGIPALARYTFAFIFAFGLAYVLFFNGELATSNMMYLTAGAYQKNITWKKAITILVYCTVFNFVGATILAWLFNQSFSYQNLSDTSFLVNAVQTKLAKTDWQNFTEGITANIFVNVAIMAYILIKEESAKLPIVISAIFMFVFLVNEHLVANFASFMLAAFSHIEGIKGLNILNVLRQWIVVFFGNWIGGGVIIGIAYAWLNKTKTKHID